MSKAFKPFNNSAGSSSERTSNLRRETMYQAVVKSQKDYQRLRGYQDWNREFSLKLCEPGFVDANSKPVSQLNQVGSYRTYLDLAIGKRLINPVVNGEEALNMQSNMGAFYRIDVLPNLVVSTTQANNGAAPMPVVAGTFIGPNNTATDLSNNLVTGYGGGSPLNAANASGTAIGGIGRISWPNSSQGDLPTDYNQFVARGPNSGNVYDNYPGYVADPYSVLTDPCVGDSTSGKVRKINPNLSVDARWLDSYWRASSGQPLTGFSFPTKVTFGTQNTLYDNSNAAIPNWMVAPMTSISDANNIGIPYYDPAAFEGASTKYCGDPVVTSQSR